MSEAEKHVLVIADQLKNTLQNVETPSNMKGLLVDCRQICSMALQWKAELDRIKTSATQS